MSNLEREILEQPAVLAELIAAEEPRIAALAKAIRRRGVKYIVVAARGSSRNAGRYARYLFVALCHLPVATAAPSLFTLYQTSPDLSDALVIGISQSGLPTDVVAVVNAATRQRAMTLAITNHAYSPLAQAAEHTILCHAGEEQSVAATKTYTAQLTALALLAATLSADEVRLAMLHSLPRWVEQTLELQGPLSRVVECYHAIDHALVISRGYNWSTAHEIALKLKELTYVAAEAYSAAEFRHGPIAMVERGFPLIVIAPQGQVYQDVYALLRDLKILGADAIVISNAEESLALARLGMALPTGLPEWLSPIVAVVPGQLLALHLALGKGLNPDRPRRLSKVTLTR